MDLKEFLRPNKRKIGIFVLLFLIGLIPLWQLGIFGVRWDTLSLLIFALINPIVIIMAYVVGTVKLPNQSFGVVMLFYFFASAVYYYYLSCFIYGWLKSPRNQIPRP